MSASFEDPNRQVVPRWRSFTATTRHGELAALQHKSGPSFSPDILSRSITDWKQNQSLSFAADLVSLAVTIGQHSAATEAARLVLADTQTPKSAKLLARACLNSTTPVSSQASNSITHITSPQDLYKKIHSIRQSVYEYPRNGVLWSDLARLYSILGVMDKATKSMETALRLAPNNRFIIRAASRLFLHQGDPSRAHDVLLNCPTLKHDPWLLAAEIAVSQAIGRTSRFAKLGRTTIDDADILPFHISELASAIATLEAFHGRARKSRQILRRALEQPSENTIAQAAWLSRHTSTHVSMDGILRRSAEADAWSAGRLGDWGTALTEAENWQADQPFSSRPAVFGSFIAATILEDYKKAIRFINLGFLSNPDDFILKNNLAFSLAQDGNVREANKVFNAVNPQKLSRSDRIVFLATSGLIKFRDGDAESGRRLYQVAIAEAEKQRDSREAMARLYLALEEIRSNSNNAAQLRHEALSVAKRYDDHVITTVAKRLINSQPPLKSN